MSDKSERISFFDKRNELSINQHKKCLKLYNDEIEKEIQLTTNTPLFLDTNVLLRYYEISFAAREKLKAFVKRNRKRIIITSQVQKEFVRNRESTIDNFFREVTAKIPEKFNDEILNKIQNFLNQNKVILKDYVAFEKDLQAVQLNLEKAKEEIDKKVKENNSGYKKLKYNDDFVDLLVQCTVLDSLPEEELGKITKEFDEIKKAIPEGNIDKLKKKHLVFPGMGDIKEKPDDPYGDYIVFHEIMNFMKSSSSNVVFLTFDTKKRDWMSESKEPYLHYIENAFCNTKQIINILDAERTLEEVLNVDVESLIEIKRKAINTEGFSVEELQQYCENHPTISKFRLAKFIPEHIVELNLAGYFSLDAIDNGISRAEKFLKAIILKDTTFLGALRYALIPINPKYRKIFLRTTKSWIPTPSRYEDAYIDWLF